MENFTSLDIITSLTEVECKSVNGGQPTEDTGFWYDAFYILVLGTVINPRPTAMATMVNVRV